jgi:3-oxoacyl-[acyl-carrier protein] reductase
MMIGTNSQVRQGVILIAGATSDSGIAIARALSAAGHRVLAVSRDVIKLDALRADLPGVDVAVADLTDMTAVTHLHESLSHNGVTVSAVIHLVGGWRRSERGIADQTEEDWRFLEASLTALRLVSREFDEEISASPNGRLIAVSSTSISRPRATEASYVALKAAAETWVQAIAEGYHGTGAAATIVATAGLAGREGELGSLVIDILNSPARTVNGQRIILR